MKTLLAALFLCGLAAQAAPLKPILTDAKTLKDLNIPILVQDEDSGVAYTEISPDQETRISRYSHMHGRCGGFEALESSPKNFASIRSELKLLSRHKLRDLARNASDPVLTVKPEIQAAIQELSLNNVHDTINWLSSFENRYNRSNTPNAHVEAFKEKLEAMIKASGVNAQVDLISHRSTPQKSIRVHIEGKSRPQEIIVLGAHLDSINIEGEDRAPGSDDNASGSADILEALRVILAHGAPERSLEFFWYAGEESGLLGSAEVAKDYKAKKKTVIAVLQLDMTLFPGSGELVISSMSDYTDPWLRKYLLAMNDAYLKVRVISDECGYGCSDHASWYRQGYPTLMPFEASFNDMNHTIHTADDKVDQQSSFTHAMTFAKIALVMGMDLGNSTGHP